MSSTGSKAWVYLAAGSAALISAAVIFHLATNKPSPSSKVLDEIEALGTAKKEANGLLSFPYYKDVFAIISKGAKQSFAVEKKALLEQRRKLLKDGNMDEYKNLVKDMV